MAACWDGSVGLESEGSPSLSTLENQHDNGKVQPFEDISPPKKRVIFYHCHVSFGGVGSLDDGIMMGSLSQRFILNFWGMMNMW